MSEYPLDTGAIRSLGPQIALNGGQERESPLDTGEIRSQGAIHLRTRQSSLFHPREQARLRELLEGRTTTR